jgi:prophage regulatory protein
VIAAKRNTLLRDGEVRRHIPVGRSTLYDWIKDGLFVTGIKLGERCTAWLEREVIEIRDARIRGADDAEIRALVLRLISERGGLQS